MMEDQHNDGVLNTILENQTIIMAVLSDLLHIPGVNSQVLYRGKIVDGHAALTYQIQNSEGWLEMRKRKGW
jgi:hypothetical protein